MALETLNCTQKNAQSNRVRFGRAFFQARFLRFADTNCSVVCAAAGGKEGSMKGLLRNNLLAAFSNAMIFSVFMLLWGIFIMAFPDRDLFIGFGLSGMAGFSINGIFCIQRESCSRWSKYKLTAPIRRTDIIKSYYTAQLVWLFWGMLFAAAASVLSSRVFRRWAFDLYTDLPMFALGISISLFLCAIFFPLFCWSRENRGEVFLVIALLCAIAVDAGLVMLLNMLLPEPGEITILCGTVAMTGCSALAFALSYPLTAHIYRKKEF